MNKETLLSLMPLADFAKQVGSSAHTVYEWTHIGRRALSGKKVKLKCVRMPYGRGVSWEMYQEFVRELNEE